MKKLFREESWSPPGFFWAESWQATEALKGSNTEEMSLSSQFSMSNQAVRRELAHREWQMCEDSHL